MILPCPVDLKELPKLPLTLCLLGLNVFIFILFFSAAPGNLDESPILMPDSLALSGRLYNQYLQQLSPPQLRDKPEWAFQVDSRDRDQLETLGALALRDAGFLKYAEKQTFHGDQVALNHWRQQLGDFQEKYKSQILFRFGLSSAQESPLAWLTYQFSHAGLFHLASNMMFLIVMGAAVEMTCGSLTLLLIYLLGGLVGGAGFLFMNAHGMIPMVGASASISALLAFYCLRETRWRIRYVYFISPFRGQYGFIYLPTLLIIPLFLVVDVSSLISTPQGLGGGVAYSAHLGGSLFGLLLGGLWRLKEILTIKTSVLR